MKYVLNAVYRAAAYDEIYRMIIDEMDLTLEDLKSLEDTFYELHDPDLSLSESDIGSNLNIKSAQDNIKERISVLREKVAILHVLQDEIVNTQVFRPLHSSLESDDNPF